jgi:uracil-DNA glycosylase family 4
MMGRKVLGVGPRDAYIMGVGEAPGAKEALRGQPFVGNSGKELTRYIERAGRLDQPDWFITNLVKWRPDTKRGNGNDKPTAADIHRDEPELAAELMSVGPAWIVAIGRYSLQWFLGRKASVGRCRGFAYPLPDATLEKIARLIGTAVDDVRDRLGSAMVVSVTHPAAGLHDTDTQSDIHADFKRLGQMVRGEVDPSPPIDLYPNPDYQEVELLPSLSPRNVGLDTEGVIPDIWCATLTWRPGMGRLVQVDKQRAMQSFRRFVLQDGHTFELHNAPHDIRIICHMLGISIYEFSELVKFEDTMQMAFIHRLVPKALKDLGARFEGVENIRKYMEIVGPYDQKKAEQYLLRVVTEFACPVCGGNGNVLNEARTHKKTGKPLAPKLEKCAACDGDGTTWEPPQEKFVWDPAKNRVRISRGWRMGRRGRAMLNRLADQENDADSQAGTDDAVRNDFEEGAETGGDDREVIGLRRQWLNIPYEFRVQVEDAIGSMPEATLRDVPYEIARNYACLDSDLTHRIRPKLEQMLRADDLWSVYEADRDVICMVTQMMHVGWKIDVPYLNELSDFLQVEMDTRLYKLERLAGHYVNPNSMKQVGELLFDQLGLQPVKLTATGIESTDNKVLKDLQIQVAASMDHDRRARAAFDALTHILDYREQSKIRSTYALALPRRVDADSRIHTELKMASVASRRLASANPNLQNQPTRTKLGKKIRDAFVCEDDHLLLSADYSQVEMRILAHESGEKSLIHAISNGMDVHALTTSKIFGIPIEKVTKSMWERLASKTLGFGIVYGISAPALKTQIKVESGRDGRQGIDVPEEQCQRWIDEYTSTSFPAIGEFMDDSVAQARRYGYVTDMWGHRRYLPGVHSAISSMRAEAERVATNHRIQAGASGVLKLAMSALWNDVLPQYRKRAYCEPLMQIHDELVFEVHKSIAEEFMHAVERTMTGVIELKVPLEADGKLGLRWSDLKD